MTGRVARALAILALVLIGGAGCGGGGFDSTPDLSAVVEVTYGDTGTKSGLTFLDDGPVRIVLADWLEDFPNTGYRQHVLRHELFHALTGIKEHPTDPSCVSCDNRSPNSGALAMPCAWEREEMRASARAPLRVRFAGHFMEIWDAATWWNQGILSVVFEVVE